MTETEKIEDRDTVGYFYMSKDMLITQRSVSVSHEIHIIGF